MPTDWASRRDRATRAARDSWAWLFATPPGGWLATWGLACLVALVIGGSTATASWVPGTDTLSGAALLGALAGGSVALMRPLRAALGLAALLLVGALISVGRVGLTSVREGAAALGTGDVAHGGALLLFLVTALIWVAGAWLAWCLLRWRQPLLGLVPAVAIFATNLLNFPAGQDAFLLYFAVLTVVLLLWAAYRRSLERAARRGLRLTPESRWDFWESGLVAAIGLLVVAFFAPPLSTVDRTVDAQSGLIKAWADIQVSMHHALPAPIDNSGSTLSTGFSESVQLGHPLVRSTAEVFTYKPKDSHSAPLYFRGLAVPATDNGEWRYEPQLEAQAVLTPGVSPNYSESYLSQQTVGVAVDMIRPPAADRSVFFYPGQLQALSRPALLNQQSRSPGVDTIDRLSSLAPSTAGDYTVSGSYSIATEAELRDAGTIYPFWVQPYASLDYWTKYGAYRSPAVEAQIEALAVQVTQGTTNPYDAAAKIENYLRQFKYTLQPPATPAGQDPLAFFLFQSKKGYCEYFASAMGDMLRSLGIPTRLVNGYGPGVFDTKTNRYVVREEDAHTWVEVYFPKYGWVPFEPTPDGTYFPIPRGSVVCQVEANACTNSVGVPGAVGVGTRRAPSEPNAPNTTLGTTSKNRVVFGLPFNPLPEILAFLGLVLAIFLVIAIRLLTPRTAGRAWRRTQMLCGLAGIPANPAETPLEFGRRLGRVLPSAGAAAMSLAQGFTRAAYAPPELASEGADDVLAAWQTLRPVLLREAAARVSRRR